MNKSFLFCRLSRISFARLSVIDRSVFPELKEVPFIEPGETLRILFGEPAFINSTFTLSIKTLRAALVAEYMEKKGEDMKPAMLTITPQ